MNLSPLRYRRRTAPPRSWVLAVVVALGLLAGCGTTQAGNGAGQGTQTPGSKPASTGQSQSRSVAGADKLKACPATQSRPPVAGALPDLSLPCLGSGPDIRLADLRGPLLVNVWAQWCPPCRAEAPYLAELQKEAGGKVRLLGIDYDDPRAELAVSFAVDHQLDYPHLVDTDKQLKLPLKIGGPPLTAFIGKDGAVAYVHRGPFRSQQELNQLVKDKLGVSW